MKTKRGGIAVSCQENDLTAACGGCGVQTGSLGDGKASELLGGGRMDSDGVLQDLDGQTASRERKTYYNCVLNR